MPLRECQERELPREHPRQLEKILFRSVYNIIPMGENLFHPLFLFFLFRFGTAQISPTTEPATVVGAVQTRKAIGAGVLFCFILLQGDKNHSLAIRQFLKRHRSDPPFQARSILARKLLRDSRLLVFFRKKAEDRGHTYTGVISHII